MHGFNVGSVNALHLLLRISDISNCENYIHTVYKMKIKKYFR